jgi:predicted ATPase
MIEKLKITNFRGIKDGEIELAPVTILLGANNSGKSTILEALFLAPNPFRKVPYEIGSFNSAAEVVHSIHESLSSVGYAFLLFKDRNDTSDK